MKRLFTLLIFLILLSSMNSKLSCQNMTQMDGRKMLHIMNNLETTVELNGVLQKNIEWHKSNNDTLRILLRKREEQLYQSNNDLLKSQSDITKWQTISAILGIITTILLFTN